LEEVGVEEKKAFTSLEELWGILNSIRNRPGQLNEDDIPFSYHYETGKRNEVRISKEIPFTFFYNKRSLDANTVNCSKAGVCIKIPDQIPLPVGDIIDLQLRNSAVRAQVVWVDSRSEPSFTMAGFKIVDGRLNL
jgi:hypothetical protein